MESWLAFRLYLSGVIVGSVVQVTMALFIVYLKQKAIGLSQRSSKETESYVKKSGMQNMTGVLRRRSPASQRGHDLALDPLLPGVAIEVDAALG